MANSETDSNTFELEEKNRALRRKNQELARHNIDLVNDNNHLRDQLLNKRPHDSFLDQDGRFWLLVWSSVFLTLLLILTGIIIGCSIAQQQYNDRVTSCVSHGGSWHAGSASRYIPERCDN